MDCKLIQSDSNDWPDTVAIDEQTLRISFRRTIRVPDNQETSLLPPDLESFPLYSVEALKANLPQHMVAKGGILFPMHDREAMWVCFESKRQFALKIYVGGINAVSGEPSIENMATSLRRQKLKSEGASLQDYVVTPQQLWLDGIATAPGQIRQFVAVPSGTGFSVEAQVTGEDRVAGLQFEVTKRKRADNKVIYVEYPPGKRDQILVDLEMMTVKEFRERIQILTGISVRQQNVKMMQGSFRHMKWIGPDSTESLKDVNICEGAIFKVHAINHGEGLPVTVKTLTGKIFTLNWDFSSTTDDLKSLIADELDIAPDQQRLISNGKQLLDDHTRLSSSVPIVSALLSPKGSPSRGEELSLTITPQDAVVYLVLRLRGGGGGEHFTMDENDDMALAAGGLIKQSIHHDDYDPESWDRSSTLMFNVQILNAKVFEKVTGLAPPKCPISAKTYFTHGLPFFDIPEAESSIAGNFDSVKSVGKLSGEMDSEGESEDKSEDDGSEYKSDDEYDYGYYDFDNIEGFDLVTVRPEREFRTLREIEDEVTRANVVSWGT